MGLAACAAPPSMPPDASVRCSPATSANIGGEAIMGAGSDGFISDTDLVFTARVAPGGGNCTTVGATVR
jgi:hypothetical protein